LRRAKEKGSGAEALVGYTTSEAWEQGVDRRTSPKRPGIRVKGAAFRDKTLVGRLGGGSVGEARNRGGPSGQGDGGKGKIGSALLDDLREHRTQGKRGGRARTAAP